MRTSETANEHFVRGQQLITLADAAATANPLDDTTARRACALATVAQSHFHAAIAATTIGTQRDLLDLARGSVQAAAELAPTDSETIWVLRTSCGCPMGATIRAMPEADAWAELAGDRAERIKAKGYTLTREPKEQAVEDVRARLGRCTHQDRPDSRPKAGDGE